MKTFYILILFFLVFEMCILVVGSLNIFPYGFYSDMDPENLASKDTPQAMITYLFSPEDALPDGFGGLADFTIPALIGVFLTIGTITSIFLQSYLPVTLVVMGLFFVPMITKSYSFFNQLFNYGNSQSLIYVGLLFGVTTLIIAVITIIELPAQGGS